MIARNFPSTPYKGLKSFSEKDAPFFFGREALCNIIVSNLISSRLTVIYGASGVGKSSILDAGVAHKLKRLARDNLYERGDPGFAVVVFRNWYDDPVAGLSACIRESVRESIRVELSQSASSLTQSVRAWTEQLDGELLVILDQFEDYFLYHAGEKGECAFASEFLRLVNSPDLRINFLISIRDDAYTKLDCFKDEIFNLFDDSIPVKHLSRDAAREAIEKPIERYNLFYAAGRQRLGIELELVEAVLDQVQTERISAGDVGGGMIRTGVATVPEAGIETAFLQLVMKRLWEMEIAAGSTTLRLKTLNDLAAKGLSSAETIVREHLLSAMNDLSESEQDIAARVFYHLVTPARAKIAYTCSDLAESENLDQAQLTPLLNKLSNGANRVLRCFRSPASESEPCFEIFHDVLVPAVIEWRRQQKQRKERAEAARQIEAHRLQAEQQRQRAEEQARLARMRLILAIALPALFLIASITIAWALIEHSRAEQNRRKNTLLWKHIAFGDNSRDTIYGSLRVEDLPEVLKQLKEKLDSKPDPAVLGPLLNNLAGVSQLSGAESQRRADYPEARRLYNEAEQYAQEALRELEKFFGEDDAYVTSTLNELAVIYYAQGKFAEVEPLLRRSLELTEKSAGRDNYYMITYIDNLAGYSNTLGKYDDAEKLSRQALDIREKNLSPESPGLAEGLKNLAEVYLNQKRYDEAEPLFKRALAILENAPGNNSEIALNLNGLAQIYRKQGKYADAERLFNQELEIDRREESEDSFSVAYDKSDLGQLYNDIGRYGEAEPLLKQALVKLENSMGVDYLVGAITQRSLAISYYKRARYIEAEPSFAKALAILEAALAPNHPYVVETLENYATFLESYAALLHNRNQQDEAAEKETRAKEIRHRLSLISGKY